MEKKPNDISTKTSLSTKLKNTFKSEDMKKVGKGLLTDIGEMIESAVLDGLSTIGDGILESMKSGWNQLLYGDSRPGKHTVKSGNTPYSRMYKRDSDAPFDTQTKPASKPRTLVDDLIFDTKPEALEVLENIQMHAQSFDTMTIGQLYGYLDRPSDRNWQKNNNWGWIAEDAAKATWENYRGKFIIKLPKPYRID